LIASGAQYRPLDVPELPRFVGSGVHYAATHLEAKLCEGQEIAIVGGGNSAGQAAVFLSNSCRHVNLLVRGSGLADSMSRYLIRRIEETPNITLCTHTEITGLAGDTSLERVTWHCALDNETVTRPINHVFLMTGAVPNTHWLQDCVALDDKGFIRTGADLHGEDLAAGGWPLT